MFSSQLVPVSESFSSEKYRVFSDEAFLGEATRKAVLIVEGDAATQAQLTQVLEAMDSQIHIDWVATAEEAEEKLDEGELYSLILSDLLLPGDLSGLDLWDFCEENYPEVPFVVVSPVQVGKFLDWLGPHRVCPLFLQKPFYDGDCRSVLEGVFESEDGMEGAV